MALADREQVDRTSLPLYADNFARLYDGMFKDWRIGAASRGLETIAKTLHQPLGSGLVGIGFDAGTLDDRVLAQVINAMNMVGMGMGIDDAVKPADLGGKHLLAKIRAGVDDRPRGSLRTGALDQH